jgi:hypothetical protein
LSYANEASVSIFFAVSLGNEHAVRQLGDARKFYADWDSNVSRIVGFCSGGAANGAVSCVLDASTGKITDVAAPHRPIGFDAEMDVEFAYDCSTNHACWVMDKGEGKKECLVCHDFNTGTQMHTCIFPFV